MELLSYVWPGLAVWLAWVWVATGQWILAKKALEVMGKRSDMASFILTITILGIALVESAVIYWLIIAFQIIAAEWISLMASIGAWTAIWFAWMWAWIWEWKLIAWALWAIDRNPEAKWKILTFMVLFVALVESSAIYWLVIAFKILWADWVWLEAYVWMWLSVWLAWLWVAIWEWILAERAMKALSGKTENISFFLTVTILGIALVESAAIYWLVVAFDIFSKELMFYAATGAGLAIWLAWLGAWVWEWILVAWAMSAMERNPQIKGKILTFMVLFVALVEVTAIYGLIIAFKISSGFQSGDYTTDSMIFLWAGLSIWLAWLWVGIGRWYLSEGSLEIMGKNPKMISFILTVSILWVALVESAAIYALIISFQILSIEWLSGIAGVGAWLAIWLTWLGAWVWEWLLIKGSIYWMNSNPEGKGKLLTFMVLFVALIEVVAIYWMIISFQVLKV